MEMMRKAILPLMVICAFSALSVASAAGYALQIFSNANLDDAIDKSDIAYVRDVIAGKKRVHAAG